MLRIRMNPTIHCTVNYQAIPFQSSALFCSTSTEIYADKHTHTNRSHTSGPVNWTSNISNRPKKPERKNFPAISGFLPFSLTKDHRCGANRAAAPHPSGIVDGSSIPTAPAMVPLKIDFASALSPRPRANFFHRDRSRNDPAGHSRSEATREHWLRAVSRAFFCPPEALLINARRGRQPLYAIKGGVKGREQKRQRERGGGERKREGMGGDNGREERGCI